MAARRLLIVMLILLGISTLAAALVPTRDEREGTTEETGTEATEATQPTEVTETGEATEPGAAKAEPTPTPPEVPTAVIHVGGKTEVIPLKLGQQLALEVRSKRPELIAIPALGRVEAAGPDTGALFYVLGQEKRSYGVQLLESGETIARIDVGRP